MRIPYGFTLTSSGTLEINRSEANVVRMIFDFYMAGASLGKVVDMLHAKQISSPTGKAKWTRAAVDHLLSNGKYIAVIGMIMLMDGQFYPITSVTQDGVEITTSIQKKLLPNYFSADFMIGENNRLINFDEVLSETLFSNWCLIQEELDIVHNTALYCLSRVEMPVDMKCAFLIEAFIGVGEIIQSKKSEFVLPKRKSREKSQLGLDLKYIISHYGQEIFRGEYQKDLEGFVQILVNSRNRIAHIKSKQNRKFLNGDESVLYLHKLSLMYRIILLDLLDIPLNRYKERLSNRIETINCWWADRCDQ